MSNFEYTWEIWEIPALTEIVAIDVDTDKRSVKKLLNWVQSLGGRPWGGSLVLLEALE